MYQRNYMVSILLETFQITLDMAVLAGVSLICAIFLVCRVKKREVLASGRK